MSIFSINNNKLQPVSEKKFDLEREIQKLTESNLEAVFGLTFVSGGTNQEFSVRAQEQDFYIDTLAFDESQKSFVIIEYKKDKSFSVIDQGYAYLSAMINHKADFILEINERLNRSYKRDEIDWEQSRVIFVSPEFTNYQRNAINFKNIPFFLYEVKLYENGLIEYDHIKPYRTTESIEAFSKDKTIQRVAKEVKVYTEEDLLAKGETVKQFYLELKDKISQLDPTLIFHPTKLYIGVQKEGNWRNILSIYFFQNDLIVDYNRSQPEDFTDPEKKVAYRNNSMKHFNQHISWVSVKSSEDVDYAVMMFKQSYKRFLKQFEGK